MDVTVTNGDVVVDEATIDETHNSSTLKKEKKKKREQLEDQELEAGGTTEIKSDCNKWKTKKKKRKRERELKDDSEERSTIAAIDSSQVEVVSVSPPVKKRQKIKHKHSTERSTNEAGDNAVREKEESGSVELGCQNTEETLDSIDSIRHNKEPAPAKKKKRKKQGEEQPIEENRNTEENLDSIDSIQHNKESAPAKKKKSKKQGEEPIQEKSAPTEEEKATEGSEVGIGPVQVALEYINGFHPLVNREEEKTVHCVTGDSDKKSKRKRRRSIESEVPLDALGRHIEPTLGPKKKTGAESGKKMKKHKKHKH